MSAEHHLCGACEGIVIYRDGCRVWAKKDRSEIIVDETCTDDNAAREYEWKLRDILYDRYEVNRR